MAVRMTRTGVGLGVAIFIGALILLVGLVIAVQRGEQARREAASEIAQQQLEDESQPGVLVPSTDGAESGNTDGTATDESANDQSDQDQSDAGALPGTGQSTPEALPETGPADTIAALAIAALAFAVASYLNSRVQLRRSRL